MKLFNLISFIPRRDLLPQFSPEEELMTGIIGPNIKYSNNDNIKLELETVLICKVFTNFSIIFYLF